VLSGPSFTLAASNIASNVLSALGRPQHPDNLSVVTNTTTPAIILSSLLTSKKSGHSSEPELEADLPRSPYEI
jgi:hypothetical protein